MIKKINIEGLNREYTIDDKGNIFDIKNNRYKKQIENKKGYLFCTFYINGKSKKFFIHRLVLMTFKPINNMSIMQVNHIDGNKKNNSLENLEWCTQSENQKHAFKNGLNSRKGIKNSQAKLSEKDVIDIADCILKGYTIREICDKYNISKSLVSAIRNKRLWVHLLEEYNFPISKYSNKK